MTDPNDEKSIIDRQEVREAENFARDQMCKDLKQHYLEKGEERTGESIEREVQDIQEDVYRRKDHDIYKR